jgi:hypothetical protein
LFEQDLAAVPEVDKIGEALRSTPRSGPDGDAGTIADAFGGKPAFV